MITLLSALLACGGGESAQTPPPPTPEPTAPAAPVAAEVIRALELAKIVQSNPNDPDAALKAAGSSREELDGLLYQIAADPALTDAYAKGLGR